MTDSIKVANDVEGSALPGPVVDVAVETVASKKYQHIVQGLVPFPFDYVGITYDVTYTDNPVTAVYKVGGASGITVATLTIAWDASGLKITSITRT
jgi:hypothetical protein